VKETMEVSFVGLFSASLFIDVRLFWQDKKEEDGAEETMDAVNGIMPLWYRGWGSIQTIVLLRCVTFPMSAQKSTSWIRSCMLWSWSYLHVCQTLYVYIYA